MSKHNTDKEAKGASRNPSPPKGPELIPLEKCKVLPWGSDTCIVELPGGAAVHCQLPPEVRAQIETGDAPEDG